MKGLLARLRGQVQAQVAVADIADVFYDDFATEESGRYWWWIRMILLDPNELIVDNGSDDLYRVSFAITEADGDAAVTFGEPSPVRIDYVDVAAKADFVAAACTGIANTRGERVAASFGSRVESRLTSTEGGGMREHIERMRAKLGLAANVPDEQVLAAAAAAMEADPDADPATPQDPATPADPATPEDPATPPADPATPATPPAEPATPGEPSTQSVDALALAQLRADAQAGADARRILQERDDDAVLTAALTAGKFPPARLEHYRALLRADREGTVTLLDELAENVIPLQARGANGGTSTGGDPGRTADSAALAAWQEQHMPDVAARKRELAASGAQRRIFTDQ